FIGDLVSAYTRVTREGTTSISVAIEIWAKRRKDATLVRVTEGTFVYVAIDDSGRPRPLPNRS
ncbi:MAG: hotdog domain-containing protein, partial [Rhodovibrionaceae bacterium]